MDIKALIQNLEALNESLSSNIIRENNDFENCVRRFQAKLADLIGISKSSNSASSKDLETVITEIRVILEEIDGLTSHNIKVIEFVKDIVPTK